MNTLYLDCFIISILGLILSTLVILKSQLRKAKLANVIYDWHLFFGMDLWINMAGTLVTVGIALMLLGPFLKQFPKYADATLFIMILFAALGYIGSDVASRFFSVVNGRINAAIDYKTSAADQAAGTADAPTPATKPQNP